MQPKATQRRNLAWKRKRIPVWIASVLTITLTACSLFPTAPSTTRGTPGTAFPTTPNSSSSSTSPDQTLTPGATASTGPTTTLKEISAEEAFNGYIDAWQRYDYAGMYRWLSGPARSRYTLESFTNRLQRIYSGIDARNLKVRDIDRSLAATGADGRAVYGFGATLDTSVGPVEISGFKLPLLREIIGGQVVYGVEWSERLIFPSMGPDDKVQVRTLAAKRGELHDRNGKPLAINGEYFDIGVKPSSFNAVKAEAIPQIAAILGVTEKAINDRLTNITNPDWFYPIARISTDEREKVDQLIKIKGVSTQRNPGRIYPGGEAFGNLIGYVADVTAEDLRKHADKGYKAGDLIGRWGLERDLEDRLRGQKGGEIYLTLGNSTEVRTTIARKDPVHGENIKLAIDSTVQNRIYEEMRKEPTDSGHAAALNPRSGEILALVSVPSFDARYTQETRPQAIYDAWNSNTGPKIFLERANAGYAPGSTFKLVTAALGLKYGTLDPDEALDIKGKTWSPGASWGTYVITRVRDPGRPVNLSDAILFSDNIYFAQQAIRIGRQKFEEGAALFGIGERLPCAYPTYRSQLSNAGLIRETLIADTGYGQGQLLVTSLDMALYYSALANNGDIMKPVMELSAHPAPEVWKPQAIAAANVPLLHQLLTQNVTNPAGSGYNPVVATPMLGKTGTAQLQKSIDDTESEENGWFIAMNTNNPRLLIAMMIESVKKRGGSRYVTPKVKVCMQDLLK